MPTPPRRPLDRTDINHDQEILKKPLHTSIAVDRDEFDEISVSSEDELHIVINVKDFRAIVMHAAPLGNNVVAYYSQPNHPIQLRYDGDAIKCEFTLMTIDRRSSGSTAQKGRKVAAGGGGNANSNIGNARKPPQLESAQSRAPSRAPSAHPAAQQQQQQHTMAPNNSGFSGPVPSLRPQITRPSQRPPPPSLQEDSLFVPQDNDHQWDPLNFDAEEDGARLEWDTNGNQQSEDRSFSLMRSRGSGSGQQQQQASGNNNYASATTHDQGQQQHQKDGEGYVEPTQNLSQVRRFGLFD